MSEEDEYFDKWTSAILERDRLKQKLLLAEERIRVLERENASKEKRLQNFGALRNYEGSR